jgi:hypothetical protein
MKAAEVTERYRQGIRYFYGANLHCANLYGADLEGVNLERADLEGANLSKAYLSDANLVRANLEGANLEGAYLEGANLSDAKLLGANLEGVNLEGANLEGAILDGANLTGANLRAYLSGACLIRVNLKGANLSGANLTRTNLRGANFEGANLHGTCLDPRGIPRPVTDEELLNAGLKFDEETSLVYGYRTCTSIHVGSTRYEPRNRYDADVFSVDSNTECHPGIYFAGLIWVRERYFSQNRFIRVSCLRHEIVHVGDKFRTRRIWTHEYVDRMGSLEAPL